jgi:hypothetical protein
MFQELRDSADAAADIIGGVFNLRLWPFFTGAQSGGGSRAHLKLFGKLPLRKLMDLSLG